MTHSSKMKESLFLTQSLQTIIDKMVSLTLTSVILIASYIGTLL
ncbi:MAG: hypothetical protein PUK16_06680 [Prevotellaceae bacterium]|nr:hypothetical protein [Prevotellaceae bacterium]MDY2633504.1 hypothetical protein [Prevotella sp.]